MPLANLAPGQAPLRDLRLDPLRGGGARLRVRLQPRLPRGAGALGGAVRRLRQRRRRSSSTSSSPPARTSGGCSRAWSCSCPTATRARGPSTRARASSATCSSRPRTTCRSASPRTRRSTSICCAARRCGRGASRSSSSPRRACCATRTPSSPLADLTRERFLNVVPDPTVTKARSGCCSAPARSATSCAPSVQRAQRHDDRDRRSSTSSTRSPRPSSRAELERHPEARDIVWVQEEPANMGALFYVEPRLERRGDGPPRAHRQALGFGEPRHRLGQGARARAADAAQPGLHRRRRVVLAAGRFLALAVAGAALACGRGEAVAPPPPAPEAAPETAIEKRVDPDRLMSTVRTLASPEYGGRRTGSEGSHLARQLITARFRAAGLQPVGETFELPFRFSHYSIRGLLEKDRPFRTVYTDAASLAATTGGAATRIILVSAHYDHLGERGGRLFPGADDNASGVAALLEAADWFSAHPPRHRFVFVAFDAEELGLRGAEAFVEDEPVEIDDVAVVVNFDMLSRNDRNEIYAAGVMRYPVLQPILDQVRKHSAVKILYGHDQEGADARRLDRPVRSGSLRRGGHPLPLLRRRRSPRLPPPHRHRRQNRPPVLHRRRRHGARNPHPPRPIPPQLTIHIWGQVLK